MATMITQRGTIRQSHAVRESFASVSTLNGRECYFDSKGSALHDYESVLDKYGLCLDRNDFLDMSGDDGRLTVAIHTDDYTWGGPAAQGDCVGQAIIMWYRMPSGRYEFTGYIA